MRKLASVALVALAVAMASASASAQWSIVRSSGCPGNSGGLVGRSGTPRIGGRIAVVLRCRARTDVPILLLGTVPPQLIPVPPPIACTQRACNLALLPLLVRRARPGGAAGIAVRIPNNPALVGVRIRFQGVCSNATRSCVLLTPALQARIQR